MRQSVNSQTVVHRSEEDVEVVLIVVEPDGRELAVRAPPAVDQSRPSGCATDEERVPEDLSLREDASMNLVERASDVKLDVAVLVEVDR